MPNPKYKVGDVIKQGETLRFITDRDAGEYFVKYYTVSVGRFVAKQRVFRSTLDNQSVGERIKDPKEIAYWLLKFESIND